MKNLFAFLLFATPIAAFAQTPIFAPTIGGSIYGVKEEFIDAPETRVPDHPFKFDPMRLSTTVGGTNWDIRMGHYTDGAAWEDGFDVIEFSLNGVRKCLYGTYDGIMKIDGDPEHNYYASQLAKYSCNGYFIEVPLTPNSKAIMFLGQDYGTDLSRLAIFVVTPNDAKLVFNRQMAIEKIEQTPNDFRMELVTEIVELWDSSGNPTGETTPCATIYLKNGVLHIKEYVITEHVDAIHS